MTRSQESVEANRGVEGNGFPRIFVGGTGRSGTTIFHDALGRHRDIYALPGEMRFIVDRSGLMDLVNSLSTQYSPARARDTLHGFEQLMRVYLATKERAPYIGFALPELLGEEKYWKLLDRYCAELVRLEFSGTAWQIEPENEGRLVAGAKKLQSLRKRLTGSPDIPYRVSLSRPNIKVVKYFPNRQELMNLSMSFVDDLFLNAANNRGKQTWSEKTPHSIFHLEFLRELFPKSIFIHIIRDPRGIVHSLSKSTWRRAPNNARDASIFLRTLYSRWFDVQSFISSKEGHHRYIEVRLEGFAKAPKAEMAKITGFCGLDNQFDELPEIDIERVNSWQREMPKAEIQTVNEILGTYVEQLGYEL